MPTLQSCGHTLRSNYYLTLWHCASPALKALYQNEIMTQLTAYGDSIPQDEAMEKSVGHIFSKMGKIQKPGLEKKMEYHCATVPTRTTELQSLKDLRGDTSETSQKQSRYFEYLSDKSPMVQFHEYLHYKMKLWHPVDDPVVVNFDGEDKVYSTSSGQEFPNSLPLSLLPLPLSFSPSCPSFSFS